MCISFSTEELILAAERDRREGEDDMGRKASDLHVCRECGKGVDYIYGYDVNQDRAEYDGAPINRSLRNPRVYAVHLPLVDGEFSIKNVTAKSTERNARKTLAACCKVLAANPAAQGVLSDGTRIDDLAPSSYEPSEEGEY